MYIKAWFLPVFLLLVFAVRAQQPYRIILHHQPEGLALLTGRADSAAFVQLVRQTASRLLGDGHLLANIDTLAFGPDTLEARIYVGARYRWQALGVEGVPEELLSKAGYRQRDFSGRTVSVREFSRLAGRLLELAANAGHPFATLQLAGIRMDSGLVAGRLLYRPGPEIRYDTLQIQPPGLVKSGYLAAYLRILPGEPFQLRHLQALPLAVNRLPYCQLADTFAIAWQNNRCRITLPLEPARANRVDALIGLLPNQPDGRTLVTGYVNLELHNLFRSGKYLLLRWRQFDRQSQALKTAYRHPNLWRSPVGVNFKFDLLRQDTAFLQNHLSLEVFYRQARWRLWLSGVFRSSRSLAAPADTLSLPVAADYRLRQAGGGVAWSNIEWVANPLRGGRVSAGVRVGSKSIRPNPAVAESVYDSLQLNPLQWEITLGGAYNLRVGRLLVAHADAGMAFIYSSERLFVNDLMRLGGVNSLRGFNDLELYVSDYALLRLELRLLLARESRLFLFYDQAYTRNQVTGLTDSPRGFGTGLVLTAGTGQLQLVYGLGVSAQQSLSLARAKIHIGYVALF